jgi:Xaa-Pro aminopeptidase
MSTMPLRDFFEPFIERRDRLRRMVRDAYGISRGAIILCADVEAERHAFRQDSTFYYLTGLTHPGIACLLDLRNGVTLFVPRYTTNRLVWVDEQVELSVENIPIIGFDALELLGEDCPGYSLPSMAPYAKAALFNNLCAQVCSYGGQENPLFMFEPTTAYQALVKNCIRACVPKESAIHDISFLIAQMRRHKDAAEIHAHECAIQITLRAQHAAAKSIKPGVCEAEVRAALESVMTAVGTRPAFPSIVAAGPNATILHYTGCQRVIDADDMVVVDIGAEYDHYAADITRTYPASGTFSARQRELYQCVLDAQALVALHAKPGYWLKNAAYAEQSLHHIAVQFFKSRGYERYFMHGIGHYLGLDVHDVGSYQEPLASGDIITIEPGLYIRDEGIGIRIEDNYLITDGEVRCLSSAIPKTTDAIEQWMRS